MGSAEHSTFKELVVLHGQWLPRMGSRDAEAVAAPPPPPHPLRGKSVAIVHIFKSTG